MVYTVKELITALKLMPDEASFYLSDCNSVYQCGIDIAALTEKGSKEIEGVILMSRLEEDCERLIKNN